MRYMGGHPLYERFIRPRVKLHHKLILCIQHVHETHGTLLKYGALQIMQKVCENNC